MTVRWLREADIDCVGIKELKAPNQCRCWGGGDQKPRGNLFTPRLISPSKKQPRIAGLPCKRFTIIDGRSSGYLGSKENCCFAARLWISGLKRDGSGGESNRNVATSKRCFGVSDVCRTEECKTGTHDRYEGPSTPATGNVGVGVTVITLRSDLPWAARMSMNQVDNHALHAGNNCTNSIDSNQVFHLRRNSQITRYRFTSHRKAAANE